MEMLASALLPFAAVFIVVVAWRAMRNKAYVCGKQVCGYPDSKRRFVGNWFWGKEIFECPGCGDILHERQSGLTLKALLLLVIGAVFFEEMTDFESDYVTSKNMSLFNPPEPGRAYAVKVGQPIYDTQLRAAGVEGYVITQYSVDENGKVYDIHVTDEQPNGIFTEAAIKALKQSIFRPALKDGKNIRSEKYLIKWSFKMATHDQQTCNKELSELDQRKCTELE